MTISQMNGHRNFIMIDLNLYRMAIANTRLAQWADVQN